MIVTIYNDTRKDTTGFYVDEAIRSLNIELKHINPLKHSIPSDSDLYILVDDGIDYEIKGSLGRLAYWAIDTHFTKDQCIKKAKNANWVFTAQKGGLENSTWLPLACDAFYHSPDAVKKEYDVCFIGNVYKDSMARRLSLIDALFKKFPNFYYGQRFFKDMANYYGKSKIIFNCSLNGDINMRVFEAMCSGSLLATDYIPELEELGIKDGVNCLVYKDEKELLNKTAYYLAKDVEREEVARNGRELVLMKHLYSDRVRQILNITGVKK